MADAVFDRGVVTQLQGEMAFVQLPGDESCEHCGARVICAPTDQGETGLLVRNPLGAKEGQEVLVTESGDLLLKLSLMQYGVPLFGFLFGVFSIYLANISVPVVPDEVLYFIAGLAGTAIGGWVAWRWAKAAGNKANMYFEISKIYNGDLS
ncbi:MAG TPA: SoxR reducing system RseC family protein [bacterium]|nr:SoxR reducing system RseC family protein [bacterium]